MHSKALKVTRRHSKALKGTQRHSKAIEGTRRRHTRRDERRPYRPLELLGSLVPGGLPHRARLGRHERRRGVLEARSELV